MKDKKKIIVFSSIAIILVAIIIVVYLYFATDVFKTNQQLFYKYLGKTEIISSDFLKQLEITDDRILDNSNSSSGTIELASVVPNEETGISDVQTMLTVTTNGLENTLTKQSYKDYTVSSNGQDLITLKYMKDDNTYAIGADNILAKYIAIENNNLKDLASKLGIEDVTNIPNSMPTNLEEILNIDEETLNNISSTYFTLIYDNIDSSHYYKIVNEDKTETIGISLTANEIKQLTILILETAKNDTSLLNLIIEKLNLLGVNDMTIENIQAEIQKNIDELLAETTSENVINISLIKQNKEVIGLKFETEYIKQEENDIEGENSSNQEKDVYTMLITFSEENKVEISMSEDNVEFVKANLNYSYDDNMLDFTTIMEIKEDNEIQTIKMQYQANNIQTDNISQQLVININENTEENYKINYTNNITFKQDVIISKLTTENCAKLNDMTSEEIGQLFVALSNRINQLLGINMLEM